MKDPEDALRALADSHEDNPVPEATEAPSARPESPNSPAADDGPDISEASASALAALSGATSSAYDPAEASLARRKKLHKPDTSMMMFRTAAIPVLVTVGLVMTGLGLWGIMIMAGNTTLPGADRPDVDSYAMIALVALPIGLILFAGAALFFWQVGQDKKKLEAYEHAKKMQQGG